MGTCALSGQLRTVDPLKWVLRKETGETGVDSAGSIQRPVAGSCEYEQLNSIAYRECIEMRRACSIHERDMHPVLCKGREKLQRTCREEQGFQQ
jgi:hypothetical protein